MFLEEELDNTWIKEFENTDKIYQDFYVDDIHYVNVHFIYINKKKEMEKIKEEIFFMKTPNKISREEIIGLLKKNMLNENRSYTLLSLLKFNPNLEPEDIPGFLKMDISTTSNDFLIHITHIDTILFHKTITMFQDLNTLYFFFLEKTDEIDSKTKKKLTKKMVAFLKSKHRKTIKK
jgi:hypothetical protein